MKIKQKLAVCFCAILSCLIGGVAIAQETSKDYQHVKVNVRSLFKGATVMGTIPAPTSYGPDIEINPVDPGHVVTVGSFPVSSVKKFSVWDNPPDVGIPVVSAKCGPKPLNAKEITVVIRGEYLRDPSGGSISCNVIKIK